MNRPIVIVLVILFSTCLLVFRRLITTTELLLTPELLELFEVLGCVVVADQLAVTRNGLAILDDNLMSSQHNVRTASTGSQATYDIAGHELSREDTLLFAISHHSRPHRNVTF